MIIVFVMLTEQPLGGDHGCLAVTSFVSLLRKVDLPVPFRWQVNFPLPSLQVLLEAASTFPRQRRSLYGGLSLLSFNNLRSVWDCEKEP